MRTTKSHRKLTHEAIDLKEKINESIKRQGRYIVQNALKLEELNEEESRGKDGDGAVRVLQDVS